mmetsp:Transcript_3758/g.5684  ORF Transcript_3758/g.5684 Transcript_3758/m.5684 type:complete len:173 (+) Transcript_3758:239-757(+)
MSCWVTKHSLITGMAAFTRYVPIKSDFTLYHSEVDPETVTFRQIWMTTHDIINFMGLFQIVLCGFFMADMMLTWMHPIKYLSQQKHVIPIFLTLSKVTQGIIFIFINGRFRLIQIINSTLVSAEFLTLNVFLVISVYKMRGAGFDNRIIKLIVFRYWIPMFSFCFLTLALVH